MQFKLKNVFPLITLCTKKYVFDIKQTSKIQVDVPIVPLSSVLFTLTLSKGGKEEQWNMNSSNNQFFIVINEKYSCIVYCIYVYVNVKEQNRFGLINILEQNSVSWVTHKKFFFLRNVGTVSDLLLWYYGSFPLGCVHYQYIKHIYH